MVQLPNDDDDVLPTTIDILSPLLKRYATSSILTREANPATNNSLTTVPTESYGPQSAPLGFRLGNGGAGYSGLIRSLCTTYLAQRTNEAPIRIEWISNHSRHTHAALCGDIVQVALTYEPSYEDLTIREGWAARICRAFNDSFILVGPASNPAQLPLNSGTDVVATFRQLAHAGYAQTSTSTPSPSSSSSSTPSSSSVQFHTRGDGSATHYKELLLWSLAGVDLSDSLLWREKHPATPREALIRAKAAHAYVLTDRVTFLTAVRESLVGGMKVFAEGGALLVNPCSALINVKAPKNQVAEDFASWLQSESAQEMVQHYGTDWPMGLPLFARGDIESVEQRFELKRHF